MVSWVKHLTLYGRMSMSQRGKGAALVLTNQNLSRIIEVVVMVSVLEVQVIWCLSFDLLCEPDREPICPAFAQRACLSSGYPDSIDATMQLWYKYG